MYIIRYLNFCLFHRASDILWTQATAKAISKTGALFFGLVTDTALGCWNENRPLKRGNIVSNCKYFFFYIAFISNNIFSLNNTDCLLK